MHELDGNDSNFFVEFKDLRFVVILFIPFNETYWHVNRLAFRLLYGKDKVHVICALQSVIEGRTPNHSIFSCLI